MISAAPKLLRVTGPRELGGVRLSRRNTVDNMDPTAALMVRDNCMCGRPWSTVYSRDDEYSSCVFETARPIDVRDSSQHD
jgi:hypothetical protein